MRKLEKFSETSSTVIDPQPRINSVATAVGFKKTRLGVNNFFKLYKDELLKGSYTTHQIYNMDETGLLQFTNLEKL